MKTIMKNVPVRTGWQYSKAETFWGTIAPCDHVIQVYENDVFFMDALAGFIGGGINAGDCCIVIATQAHLDALQQRLEGHVVRVDTLISDDRYIPLIAEDVLSKIMVNGWPDEARFMQTCSELMGRAKSNNRKVRVFGGMVAILWSNGQKGATLQLEHLWNKFCKKEEFCLFCAYPKKGFVEDMNSSLEHICCMHSKMISGSGSQLTEVLFRDLDMVSSGQF